MRSTFSGVRRVHYINVIGMYRSPVQDGCKSAYNKEFDICIV